MSDIHFSNLELDDTTRYFIYVGELKNYGLNIYLREALSRHFDCPFDFISIVPDIFEQYNYENLMVVNPLAGTEACRYGSNYNCRLSGRDFVSTVSESQAVRQLIRNLLKRQPHVYIAMFESRPEMTLGTMDGVSVLGPDGAAAHALNSKIFQYTQLKDHLPMVEFGICQGRGELLRQVEPLWDKWSDGIFITREYSAAGVNSILAHNTESVAARFEASDEPFLYSRYIPHEHDPTVLAVVANPSEVYIAGIADQRIEGGTRFTGSTFPTCLDHKTCDALRRYTQTAGKWMAAHGYRGIFGCDYLVAPDGDVRFLEINARKQGTTLEFCCTLEQLLPPGTPSLMELEFHAVEHGRFPSNLAELETIPQNLHWGTYNYKLSRTVRTNGYIPHGNHEREAFARVHRGNLKKDFLILEHVGSDFVVACGAFIARIVALGRDSESVRQGLEQGRRTIDLTISDHDVGMN